MGDPNGSNLDSSTSEVQVLKKKTSRELLTITGDGSRKAVIQSLIRKKCKPGKSTKLQTHKMTRSSLFDQLDQFLPKIKQSTSEILSKTEEQRQEMDIENIEGCSKVVEMNIFLEQMRDKSCSSDTEDSDDSDVTLPDLLLPKSGHPPTRGVSERRKGKRLIAEIGGDHDNDDDLASNPSPASEGSR